MKSMLEIKDLCFTYKGENFPTIDKLSVSIETGEFVCVIGPSGCGKSTIFKLINGLLKPESGSILVGGEDIAKSKSYCGYMPQRDLLMPWRNVLENVRLPLEIKKELSKKEMDEAAEDALTKVGLKGMGKKAPYELSGGMRQRAAFARTMLTGCDLLLLDEPFSALDYLTRLSLREWLLEQWERDHKTIVFITHDVEEAVFLSNRVLAVTKFPISELKSVEIPAPYPRSLSGLNTPKIAAIRESLVEMLKRETGGDGNE